MSFDAITRRIEVGIFSALVAVIAALLTVNVMLQRRNHQLALENHALSAADGPTIGSRISTLHGQTVSHERVTINTLVNNQKILLLVFSPSCPYCKIKLPTWREILKGNSAVNVLYLDISGSVTGAYLSSSGLPQPRTFPLVTLNPEERILFDLRATPTTVLLDPKGVVLGKWVGVITQPEERDLNNLLNKS